PTTVDNEPKRELVNDAHFASIEQAQLEIFK
ncbi:hypothetical protein SMU68_10168, partial [Streptococcus mutans NFSM1]